jgi:hypothetical protein
MGKWRIYELGLVLCLFSCSNRKSQYLFAESIVTRIDYQDKSVFLYGDNDVVTDTNSYFEVSYNDMRDGIDMYLVFKEDYSKIEVIPFGLGNYNFKNANGYFFDNDYPNNRIRKIVDSLKNEPSVGAVRISNSEDLERRWYIEDKSRVKVVR